MKLDLKNTRFIDLTHTLNSDVATWNGSCGFKSEITHDYEDSEDQVKFRVNDFTMRAGIGTHMDAPAHCFKDAACIHDLKLEQLIAPCIKIDVSAKASANYVVNLEDIQEFERKHGSIAKGSFALVYTGWSKHWQQPEKYRNDLKFPSISKAAAEYLHAQGIIGLGIDTLSPDVPESGYPVHQLILGAGKYIVENIANADQLPEIGSYIFVMPIKVENATEAPIRLIAITSV